MFPAHAGMIRTGSAPWPQVGVFPAHAGMIRLHNAARPCLRGVPRPRGDDPEGKPMTAKDHRCSPPTRE